MSSAYKIIDHNYDVVVVGAGGPSPIFCIMPPNAR